MEERQDVCSTALERLKLGMLTLVDTMDNKTEQDYTAWPERLYVVSKQGKIAYKGRPGPGGFNPQELSEFLTEFVKKRDQRPERDAVVTPPK
jgi:type I thyroxine 5'-deiodinase